MIGRARSRRGEALGVSIFAFALILVASCGPATYASRGVPKTTFTTLSSPSGMLSGVAWFRGGIVTSVFGQSGGTTARLWLAGPSSTARPIGWIDDPVCHLERQLRPATRPDGLLIYVRECVDTASAARDSLVSWDGATVRLVVADVPSDINHLAWSASRGMALAERGSVICEAITWLGPTGTGSPDVGVEADGKSFRMDDPAALGDDCSASGRALLPTVRADGLVAFFASAAAIGRSGQARLDAPLRIFTFGPTDTIAKAIGDEVMHPQSLAWSPDGRSVAYSGQTVDGDSGIWVLDVKTGQANLVLAGRYADVAWSPDGRSIAAVSLSIDAGADDDHIVVIELAPDG